MSTRDALVALFNGESHQFRTIIEDELQSRSMEAIEADRFSLGANLFAEGCDDEESEDDYGKKKKKESDYEEDDESSEDDSDEDEYEDEEDD